MDDTIYKPATKSRDAQIQGRQYQEKVVYLSGISNFIFDLACGLERVTVIVDKVGKCLSSLTKPMNAVNIHVPSSASRVSFTLVNVNGRSVFNAHFAEMVNNRTQHLQTVEISSLHASCILEQLGIYQTSFLTYVNHFPGLFERLDDNSIYDTCILSFMSAISMGQRKLIGRTCALMLSMKRSTSLTNIVFCIRSKARLDDEIDNYYRGSTSQIISQRPGFVINEFGDRVSGMVDCLVFISSLGTEFSVNSIVKGSKSGQTKVVKIDKSSLFSLGGNDEYN